MRFLELIKSNLSIFSFTAIFLVCSLPKVMKIFSYSFRSFIVLPSHLVCDPIQINFCLWCKAGAKFCCFPKWIYPINSALFIEKNILSLLSLLYISWLYMRESISGLFLFNYSVSFLKIFIFKQFLKVIFHLQLLQNIGYIPCVVQYILWAYLTTNSLYLPLPHPYILSILEPILHYLNYCSFIVYIHLVAQVPWLFVQDCLSYSRPCIPIYILDLACQFLHKHKNNNVGILTGTVLNLCHLGGGLITYQVFQ